MPEFYDLLKFPMFKVMCFLSLQNDSSNILNIILEYFI